MFNDAEKAQIAHLVIHVVNPLDAALGDLSFSIQQNQDSPALLKPPLLAIKEALRETSLTLTFLLNGNGSNDFTPPDPAQRAAKIAQAWFHLDRVTPFIQQAISQLQLCTGSNAAHARTAYLTPTLTQVAAVNRTLAYLDPSPNTRGTLVGPHGDFNRAEWESWRAWWYALDCFEYALPLFGSEDPAAVSWYAFVQKIRVLYDTIAHSLARWADIDTTNQEVANRALLNTLPAGPFGVQFWLLLAMGQQLTDFQPPTNGAPLRYQEMQDALKGGTAALAAARSRITDSWRHLDRAHWFALLAFPGCDMVNDPMGCAAQLPSQNVTLAPPTLNFVVNGKTFTYQQV